MVRKLVFIVAVNALLAVGSSPGSSAEPVERFLEGLQERGYFDLALQYLDRMATSELAPATFQEEIDFRRGMLLVTAARSLHNPVLRQQRLDGAEQALERFLRAHPEHASVAEARSQLGNILVERARSLMAQAKQETAERKPLEEQAGELFAKAHAYLVESREDIAGQLKSLNGNRDRESVGRRDALRAQYVQTKLAAARVLFEQAETLKGDKKKFDQKLTEAANAFADIAQKYRKLNAGLMAILFEGECYQRLGEDKRALSYFTELLQYQDNSLTVRRLKTKAMTLAIASWLKDAQGGHERAIAAGSKWLATARGEEDEDPAWDELRLALARAYQKASIAAERDKQSARALADARELAEEVARRRSPSRDEAQRLLVDLGRNGNPKSERIDPETAGSFSEARDAAKKALDEMKVADTAARILQSQAEKISDVQARHEIAGRVAEAQEKSAAMAIQARELFERAAQLATPGDQEDLHAVRYYLAYLYYMQADYHRAAVLASFVATRYPDSVAARECANVALAAHQRIYQQLDAEDRQAQAGRIGRIAELMISKWPGQAQAGTALKTLLDVTLQQGDLEKAEEYLARIPEDSPRRADAELRVGQAIWRTYLSTNVARQDEQSPLSTAESHDLREKAKTILAQGIARSDPGPATETVVRAALSLAQIYVEAGQPHQALEVLSDARFGPMSLLEQSSPVAERIGGLAIEAYKTAIRAYVSAAAVSLDPQASIKGARDVLDRLRDSLQERPDGQQTLISIYVGLARDLERQLTMAAPETRHALTSGFETFLRGAGQASREASVLHWVAETFYQLGKSLEQENDVAAANRYYREAATSYQKILRLAQEQPGPVDSDLLTQVQARLAMTQRELGQYPKAIDGLAAILAKRGAILNFQIEAARTFQAWGDAGNAEAYLKAVRGDQVGKDGRNIIWGWGRLASIVGRPDLLDKKPALRATLHEARYNLALCHYKYGLVEQSRKRELLLKAKRDIVVTYQLYPKLGDAHRTKQYEDLLKTIQKSLGENAVGFQNRGESP